MTAIFGAPARALVRGVPQSYERCLRRDPAPVDPSRARSQVEAYARALTERGVVVQALSTDENCPDCCFIEDTAIVLDSQSAFITRPGAPARRGEVPPVALALRHTLARVASIDDETATIDGGDVMRIGDTLLVGLSERTTLAGARALERAAKSAGLSVATLSVGEGLHLKSAMTLVRPDLVVALEGTPGLDRVRSLGARTITTDEPAGANVLSLGSVVLVSSAAPRTIERLEREGVAVRVLDVTELHKGDGALTCLSLRIPPPGVWCA